MAQVADLNQDGCADYLVSALEETVQGMFGVGSVYLISGFDGHIIRRHSGLTTGDLFGWAVFSIGDANQDGSPEYGAVAHGARRGTIGVHAFDGATGALLHQVSVPTDGRSYGNDAVGVGDWNADGIPDYAVADYFYGVGSSDRMGRVYFYSGLDGVLIDQVDGVSAGQGFGKGLCGGGDANADGQPDLLVWSEWGLGDSVDVIDGSSGSMWYRLSSLTGNGYFGDGLDFIPDLDGDGADEILIGATNAGIADHGEAYLFSGYSGALIYRWYGEASQRADFGEEVACIGDQDGDGVSDWAIGSPSQFRPNFEGKVFLYSGADGRLIHTITSAAGTPSHLGEALDGGLDVNGDGQPDALITDNTLPVNNVTASGAAYVFSFDPFLNASDRALSSSAGGTITFSVSFPATEGGLHYRLLASTNLLGSQGSGSKPWVTAHGVSIPLVETALLYRMWRRPPSAITGAAGILDANGNVAITMSLPPGAAASEIGRTFRFAVVSITGSGQASASSAAVLLSLEP